MTASMPNPFDALTDEPHITPLPEIVYAEIAPQAPIGKVDRATSKTHTLRKFRFE